MAIKLLWQKRLLLQKKFYTLKWGAVFLGRFACMQCRCGLLLQILLIAISACLSEDYMSAVFRPIVVFVTKYFGFYVHCMQIS